MTPPDYGRMTTRRYTKNLFATSTAAVLALGLVAGCSSDGSLEDYCKEGEALSSGDFAQDIDPNDPDAMKAAFDDIVTKVKDIDAPDEIKDDWNVLVDSVEKLNDGMKDLDLTNADDQAKFMELTTELNSDEVTAASDRVTTFNDENCEA